MNKFYQLKASIKQTKWIEFLLGIACTLIILLHLIINVPVFSDLIHELDYQIYDQIVRLNLRPEPQNPNVVIIDINEDSVKQEGRWPWPRDKMAQLITNLKQSGVVTIGLDIIMSEPETNYASALKEKLLQNSSIPQKDQSELVSALNNISEQVDTDKQFMQTLTDKNIVLGFLFQYEKDVRKGSLPPPLKDKQGKDIDASEYSLYDFPGYNGILDSFIKTSTQGGFVTNLPDPDGTVRHALLLASDDEKVYPSLSLAVAMNYLLVNQIELVKSHGHLSQVQLDGQTIPTNARGQILIPFWGSAGNLPYYSASDIINHRFNADELNGAVAIVGSSMTLFSDLHSTPAYQLFPGVEIVGNMVKGIASQQIPTEFDWYSLTGALILLVIGLILATGFSLLFIVGKIIITVTFILGACGVSIYLFSTYNIYLPSAILVTLIGLLALSNFSFSYINERRQKRLIKQLFGQYVPEDYVNELLDSPEHHSMEGQTRNMTVLFSDIRNFTTISETLDAIEVKHLLNSFFTPVTEIIFNNKGTIDKYVGDMVIAFWGAPMEDLEHTNHAIAAALAVVECLPLINAELQQQGLPELKIGVGLATGPMSVGDMGSKFRRAYTVLGDTVNLASRLQDLTKFYQVPILTNDETRKEQIDYLWRPIDKVAVKGRSSALTIYQPIGMVATISAEIKRELEDYQATLALYYQQEWKEAEKGFKGLLANAPGTHLYQLYLARITQFKKTPPPENWNGVYIHTQK